VRKITYSPNISDVDAYEKQFLKWWIIIQPSWQVSGDKLLKDLVDGEWDDLHLPGLNGLFSVIVGLFYWGLAVNRKPSKK
jgi:hypothetical protein